MKIAFLCNEYPPHPNCGGIGTFTHSLAHGLFSEGHRVTVVGIGPVAEQRDDHGVRVVVLAQSSTRGIAWFVTRKRLLRWLKQEVQAGNIDVIEVPDHSGMYPFTMSGCTVVVRLHMSTTSMLHSAGQKAPMILRQMERRTLSLHRNWIAVSDFVLQNTTAEFGITPNRSVIIHNPVVLEKNAVSPPSGLPEEFVLYAGAVREQKGAFVLAEAARSFLKKHPTLHLVYCGQLSHENGMTAAARIRRIVGPTLANRVHCLGFQEHAVVIACMKRAKVFAAPSKLEACSLVPIEAMLCEAPVVHTISSSGPEIVDDGITGLLADPENSQDVEEKVVRILRDQKLANTLKKNGKLAATNRFSMDQCICNTIDFYKRCRQDKGFPK